ncbi:MAG: hypothetical protein CME06_06090 [Gemmatimonadetes bacterium]|nr:hypothetical protein [Gemmatimonadota bacterium]
MSEDSDRTLRPTKPHLILVLLSLCACAVTLVSGMAASIVYSSYEPLLRSVGITLQHIRPVHETFAFAWAFLGGTAIVYFYLHNAHGPLGRATQRRMVVQLLLWVVAGLSILITLLDGSFSGREYLGYQPLFSLLILLGWLVFAWNFFDLLGTRLKGRPVYLYMWTVAIPLFVITYIEGHLYLLDHVSGRPIRDIAIQWKSNGVLVGSFNLLVYGSLMYVAGMIRGDDAYAHSRTAFALFCIGVLNTFTNYGHHTYHLPQTPWLHWISFSVSMLEAIILAKVFIDLLDLRNVQVQTDDLRVTDSFMRSATYWTGLMLILALLISIPPLNAMIHGTHVVVSHSMGTMVGIDTMILMAALSFVIRTWVGVDHPVVSGARVRVLVPVVNLFLFVFWLAFFLRGLAAGWSRYTGPSSPDFSTLIAVFPPIVLLSGFGLALALLWILAQWGLVVLGRLRSEG